MNQTTRGRSIMDGSMDGTSSCDGPHHTAPAGRVADTPASAGMIHIGYWLVGMILVLAANAIL